MIFRKETWEEKKTRVGTWHRWFAWYPVSWDGGWAWLSYVERRMEWWSIYLDCGWHKHYRPIGSE